MKTELVVTYPQENQDWREVVPMWGMDLLDDILALKNWRKRFIAGSYASNWDGLYFTVLLMTEDGPKTYWLDRKIADELYDYRKQK